MVQHINMQNDENNREDSSESSTFESDGDENGRAHELSSYDATSNDSSSKKDDGIRNTLAKQDTFKVDMSRMLVLLILVISATAVCVVVYFISSNTEAQQFQSQYEGIATKVLDSFQTFTSRISAVNSMNLAATVAGYNKTTNTTHWPFVTLPSFEQRASTVLSLSYALDIQIHPLVYPAKRLEWERYSVGEDSSWIKDGLDYQQELGLNKFEYNPPPLSKVLMINYTSMPIVYEDVNGTYVIDDNHEQFFLPTWQSCPVLKKDRINININHHNHTDIIQTKQRETVFDFSDPLFHKHNAEFPHICVQSGKAKLSNFDGSTPGTIRDSNPHTARFATLKSIAEKKETVYTGSLIAMLYLPIYDNFLQTRKVVGVLSATILWRQYLLHILPKNVDGVIAVIENPCDGFFSFEINGDDAVSIGLGDVHDLKYSDYAKSIFFESAATIADGTKNGLPFDLSGCIYSLHVYPSDKLLNSYHSNTPVLITFAVAMVFLFTILMFLVYNHLVEKRQKIILNQALQSTAIVSSLFPKQVRDRLLHDDGHDKDLKKNLLSSGNKIKSFFDEEQNMSDMNNQIADLFPHCTVMFADIVGFTAWSSTRGPESVFVLLQTLYQGFDKIAKKRSVFKVETIGDCYLAVTGLPDPQAKHALIMCRFASECKNKMVELMRHLEVQLGPDCSDLRMRFGIHSGPVTAGVLRGDRARFQLFGDTVNTAARMESTGTPDKIQISHVTADLLSKDGKGHWIRQRDDWIEAKGKGLMKTFWMNPNYTKTDSSSAASTSDYTSEIEGASPAPANSALSDDIVKRDRLIDWMTDLLIDHIKKMMTKKLNDRVKKASSSPVFIPLPGTICLDEVQEVIEMCNHNDVITPAESVIIEEWLVSDLRSYVRLIANMYRANAFHNFEHACHVTMSVSKLLKRIVSPEISDDAIQAINKPGEQGLQLCLHNFTYGITSDPLAQFAIVFSAIIHDVDHRGCSNAQLIKEEPSLGTRYRNKSVAEQNSLDISWNLLMSEQFEQLRSEIFGTQEELLRFRQFIVSSVLATDIFDKELNDLRRMRWEKAFSGTKYIDSAKQNADLKATIVIEHIIQASDVAHTMQHWHIYQKWNKRLFFEMYQAFRNGRMTVDPSNFWYNGELSFFDNYIIPLANKLKDCNVFGVSSDEYLNYAVNNRLEWEQRGEAIVQEMINEFAQSM